MIALSLYVWLGLMVLALCWWIEWQAKPTFELVSARELFALLLVSLVVILLWPIVLIGVIERRRR